MVVSVRTDFRPPERDLPFSILCFLNTIVFQRKKHFSGFCCDLKFKDSLANVHDSVWVFAPPYRIQPRASSLAHQKYAFLTLPDLTLQSVYSLIFQICSAFYMHLNKYLQPKSHPQMLKISIAPWRQYNHVSWTSAPANTECKLPGCTNFTAVRKEPKLWSERVCLENRVM